MSTRRSPRALAAALVMLAAPPVLAQDATAPSRGAPLPVTGRSVVTTPFGIVATSQPLASQAGAQVLALGGNAVDAAIAANAVIGVTEPTGNGIGGDLFALVYDARTKRVHGLNASGWAASGLTPELLRARGITEMPERGVYTVTVPGAVAGWQAMHERFGSRPFSTILAPAIYYARHGFPVTEVVAGLWPRSLRMLNAHPNARAALTIDGRAPRAGEMFRRPDLARSLEHIAARGARGFYEGPIAEAILALLGEQGSPMTAADLAGFRAEWVEPISTEYRGWTVYEIPPNTQGIAALAMLNLMERFPLGEWGFHSPEAMHVMIEAKKLAYADMLRYVGDQRFGDVPVRQMLSDETAARRAALIDTTRAACRVEPSVFDRVTDGRGSETIYMTVVDRDGNIVSLIQSNYSGFGSGLVPAGTGFMLHNRGALFTLEPNHPNTLAPRKRPLHTIIPGMMQKADTVIGFGIMGGWNQAQAHAQFVANIVDYGMNLQQALEAGRFTKRTFEGCDVEVESLVPEATRARLTALGHELEVRPPRTFHFGFGQAVMTLPSGVHVGASDPRHDGAAIPEPSPAFETRARPAAAERAAGRPE